VNLGSITLGEEQRLRVCRVENRVLRKIFGPKREEAAGEWREYIPRIFMICTAQGSGESTYREFL
jgi:hypothetical protein